MAFFALFASLLAFGADDASCATLFSSPPEAVSVAWVSPVRRTVGRRGWMTVVQTADLRARIQKDRPTVGELLHELGLRRRATDPRRLYKITIFEVRSAELCRPIVGSEGEIKNGVVTCSPDRRAEGDRDGCGYATGGSDRGPDLYKVRWADAAGRGFCVFPADRFVVE